MSLTINQQAYIDNLTDNFQAFKSAMIQALNANNNPTANLVDLQTKGRAVYLSSRCLGANIGTYGNEAAYPCYMAIIGVGGTFEPTSKLEAPATSTGNTDVVLPGGALGVPRI
jgi:hypothetical protein